MSALQTVKEKLAEMFTKVDINDPLSIDLQTVYTLIESAINEPISREEAKQIRANDIHNCPQGTTWSDSANKCVPNV